ncbi:Putative membrane spanning protein (plasmid) [Borrelia crocidurae DOU]|uniref:Putative membrane spanning protein n=1 Tax=Borrelia crocidurae DOU TaxID=1293575 RepID=W5SLA0_9SPIR|nr:virulence associated lipoprotein [Borrelia crocidurae]AHH07453.1 Putative membrane spanning protein [Borrelia crocidurae DOU]
MKRKNFILFMMFIFILIGVLLVSCGPQKRYVPVAASDMTQGTLDMPFEKPLFDVAPQGVTDPEIFVDFLGAFGAAPVKSDDAPADPAVVAAFLSYVNDHYNETPEQRIKKEKAIEKIKGKIPVKVKEILKTHVLAGTDVSKKLIVPEFNGHFLIKHWGYFFSQTDLGQGSRNLGVLSTLFWGLTCQYGSLGYDALEYLEEEAGDNLELQKEFYLALEYNDELLKPFAYVYGKLSYEVDFKSSYDEQTLLAILKLKHNIVERLRAYAKAYYIDVYQSLLAKENKLDKLSLKDVRFLKRELNELELAKQELRTNVIQRFVNGVKKYKPYSLDSKHDVWPHLRDTFNEDFDIKFYDVIDLAERIKNILDKIQ